jgi:hypothetical protein
MAENPAIQPAGEQLKQSTAVRDDRILRETRIVSYIIPPFLIVAFIMLYFFPDNTEQLFAWTIRPTMTPLIMGAGYAAGGYFFVRAIMATRWHTVSLGFPAITAFTWFMGLATFLHFDRFNHGHISFFAWLILYIVTPFLVPIIWWRNQATDPHVLEPNDVAVPQWVRLATGIVGAVLFLIALFMFIFPQTAISIWPWTLTPLTARVVAGWFALPGVVGMAFATDVRWSAWRITLQSQIAGVVLILIGVVRAWSNFDTSKLTTWLFVIGMVALMAALVSLYAGMEALRRKKAV